MVQKSNIITTHSIREYGIKNGSYLLEAPIVDLQFLETIDYSELDITEDNPFEWLIDAVLDAFHIDVTDSNEEDDMIVYDGEIEKGIDNTAWDILKSYTDKLPKEISRPLNYMINSNGDTAYKTVLCMDTLDNEQKFNIFKEWVSNRLLENIKHNLIHGENGSFNTDLEDNIEDIIEYLYKEKNYELIFNILISLMYAYRLILALSEHCQTVYNYIAEQLFEIWDNIEDMLIYLYRPSMPLNNMVDSIFDYLLTFKNHYGLSILDSKMYLTLSILSYEENEEILEYLSKAPRNQIAKRYMELAQYVFYENYSNSLAEVMYKNMDETNKIIISRIYKKYHQNKQIVDIMEDVRDNTLNKKVYDIALDNLEYAYNALEKFWELKSLYYIKLKAGDESAFAHIYDYIMSSNMPNEAGELESLVNIAKESLSPNKYFRCLINMKLYDKCIDVIKNSDSLSLLNFISTSIKSKMYKYDGTDYDLNCFLKESFEALKNNKTAMGSLKIKKMVAEYFK